MTLRQVQEANVNTEVLEIFHEPLVSSADAGLESTDPRLGELADLANRRDYVTAASLAEKLVQDGVYDIRALSYLFYHSAFEGGFAAVADMLRALENLVGASFQAIGPTRKREEHFDRRLAWIFGTLVDALAYEEAKGSSKWDKWSSIAGLEDAARAVVNAEALAQLLSAGPFENASRSLASFQTWLRAQHERLSEPSREPVENASEPALRDANASDLQAATMGNREPDGWHRSVEVSASHHFVELCAKLRAFEELIERRQFDKAALIADDIQNTLDNFDPRLYFPDTFSRFSELLAKNIDTIADHWEQRETVAWKTMAQFYRVNLKGFVEG